MLSGRAVGCVNTKVRASYFIISYLSCRSCIALSARGVWPGQSDPAQTDCFLLPVWTAGPGHITARHRQPGQTGDLQVLPDSTDSTDSPTLVLTGLFAVTASLPPPAPLSAGELQTHVESQEKPAPRCVSLRLPPPAAIRHLKPT